MPQRIAHALGLTPAAFYVIGFSVLMVMAFALGLLLNRIFHRWAVKLRNGWGEIVLAILESLSIPLCMLAAMYTALEVLTLPRQYERIGSRVIFGLVIVVIFYFFTKVLVFFLSRWSQREPSLQRVAQPAVFIVRVLFALLAAIIILENFGIHLTAVWTTLGVGSVAVALALQDTLGNFFAGLYILADRPVNPGDYVRLDGGQEGYVIRVGWRSTVLQTLGNNLVVIPNSTLAKAVITNFSMPEERMSLDIRVGVPHGTDARRVEQILVEVAQQAAVDGFDGLLAAFPPEANLIPGFGISSLDFTLSVKVRRFVDQFAVQSELRKRVLERFQKEGIPLALPTQVVLADAASPARSSADPTASQRAAADNSPATEVKAREHQ
jgi:small-conductance mechanosensitive channel